MTNASQTSTFVDPLVPNSDYGPQNPIKTVSSFNNDLNQYPNTCSITGQAGTSPVNQYWTADLKKRDGQTNDWYVMSATILNTKADA
jgi:hypothetical protein